MITFLCVHTCPHSQARKDTCPVLGASCRLPSSECGVNIMCSLLRVCQQGPAAGVCSRGCLHTFCVKLGRPDLTSPFHWKISDNSPTSPTSARSRLRGVWYCTRKTMTGWQDRPMRVLKGRSMPTHAARRCVGALEERGAAPRTCSQSRSRANCSCNARTRSRSRLEKPARANIVSRSGGCVNVCAGDGRSVEMGSARARANLAMMSRLSRLCLRTRPQLQPPHLLPSRRSPRTALSPCLAAQASWARDHPSRTKGTAGAEARPACSTSTVLGVCLLSLPVC